MCDREHHRTALTCSPSSSGSHAPVWEEGWGEMLQEPQSKQQPSGLLFPFVTLRSCSKSSRHLTPWRDHHTHGQNCCTQAGTAAGNCESPLRVLPGVEVSLRRRKRAVCQVSSSLSSSPTSREDRAVSVKRAPVRLLENHCLTMWPWVSCGMRAYACPATVIFFPSA